MSSQPNQQWPKPPRDWLSTNNILFAFFIGIVLVCSGGFGILLLRSGDNASPKNPNDTAGRPTVTAPQQSTDPASLLKDAERRLGISDFRGARDQATRIPPFAPEASEARKLLKRIDEAEARDEKEREPALRETLRLSYREAVAGANPHLNFIGSQITSEKGGFAIWATHDFFTQYSFSAGDDAKVVQLWIAGHREELRRARVKKVGLKGGGYSGRCWLEIK